MTSGESVSRNTEAATDAESNPFEFVFRLYVSGATHSSLRAVVNSRKLFERYLKGRYKLEILNIAECVSMARQDQIVATPTLVKVCPQPLRRFIGDITSVEQLLLSLNLEPAAEKSG